MHEPTASQVCEFYGISERTRLTPDLLRQAVRITARANGVELDAPTVDRVAQEIQRSFDAR